MTPLFNTFLTQRFATGTKLSRSFALFVLILCLSSFTLPASAYVISIKAAKLPQLVGKTIGHYGFFALQNGQLEPIPHQWVPWSIEDTPYFSEDPNLHADGDPTKIESSTRLLLRFRDGGKRLDSSSNYMNKPTAEISVTYQNQTRFFYLIKNPYLRNAKHYVNFNPQKMRIQTTHYALFMDPDNMLVWNDFYYKGYESSKTSPVSILDTMKLRLSSGIFTSDARVTLTNDNLKPEIEQIITGPIATLVYADTSLKVTGITVLSIRNHFVIKPNQTTIYAKFTLPSAAGLVLEDPAISISLDGNTLAGSTLVTSWTGSHTAITDGKLSVTEKQMKSHPMPRNGWLFFDTQRHFNLLAQLSFSKNLNTPVSLFYQDSTTLKNEPERFVGQWPNVGFYINKLPFGQLFSFKVRLIYNGQRITDPTNYAQRILDAPQVHINLVK